MSLDINIVDRNDETNSIISYFNENTPLYKFFEK